MHDEVGYDEAGLRRALAHCGEVRDELLAVRRYLREEVCSAAGFTGLLHPLGEVLEEVGGAVDEAAQRWVERWDAVTDEVVGTARALARADDEAARTFARLAAHPAVGR